MNKQTVSDIISSMGDTGLVPVFNHDDPVVAEQVLINAHEAGIRVFEFTNRGSNPFRVFTHLAEVASKLDDMILGIGTIWTLEQADRYLEAGAQFVVSPGLVPGLGAELSQRNVLWVPGCGTVSEVNTARTLGAELIKIFPGNVLGPSFAKAVKSVIPKINLMPTGGVKPTASNLSEWFASGVLCVGMGSQLFSKSLIRDEGYSQLQDEISDALSLVRSVRQNLN